MCLHGCGDVILLMAVQDNKLISEQANNVSECLCRSAFLEAEINQFSLGLSYNFMIILAAVILPKIELS